MFECETSRFRAYISMSVLQGPRSPSHHNLDVGHALDNMAGWTIHNRHTPEVRRMACLSVCLSVWHRPPKRNSWEEIPQWSVTQAAVFCVAGISTAQLPAYLIHFPKSEQGALFSLRQPTGGFQLFPALSQPAEHRRCIARGGDEIPRGPWRDHCALRSMYVCICMWIYFCFSRRKKKKTGREGRRKPLADPKNQSCILQPASMFFSFFLR